MTPRTLTVSGIRVEPEADGVVLRGHVTCRSLGFKRAPLWFKAPSTVRLRPSGDAFAAGLLAPASAAHANLRVEGALSPVLAANLTRLSELISDWDPPTFLARCRPVRIDADVMEEQPSGDEGVGLFFTAGVDSLFAAVKRPAGSPPPELIAVHGLDFDLERTALRHKLSALMRAAADDLGLGLLEVETNLKRLTDPMLHWDLAHGGALAAVGLAIGVRYREIHVAGDDTAISGRLAGTQPRLVPLWSRRNLRFVAADAGTPRSQKTALLAGNETARRHLRVCWRNTGDEVNCGRCKKCVRTMMQLDGLGVLDRFRTLPDDVPVNLLKRKVDAINLFQWENLERDLESRSVDGETMAVLRDFVERSRAARMPLRPLDLMTSAGRRKAVARGHLAIMRELPPPLRTRLRRAARAG